MSPKQVAAVTRKLRAEQAKIGKTRDTLRELMSDLEAVADDAEEAFDSLEHAIDALSRLQ